MDSGLPPVPERAGRRRLHLWRELLLAVAPTTVVLLSLVVVRSITHYPFLFTSLASSAFLIYLDPGHVMNRVRTLLWAQSLAAVIGAGALALFGAGYLAAAVAMSTTILAMVTLDVVQPPAVSTALGFAFHARAGTTLLHFGWALGMIVALVLLQRLTRWLLARLDLDGS